MLESIWYEGLELTVFYLFMYISYNKVCTCMWIGRTPPASASASALHSKLVNHCFTIIFTTIVFPITKLVLFVTNFVIKNCSPKVSIGLSTTTLELSFFESFWRTPKPALLKIQIRIFLYHHHTSHHHHYHYIFIYFQIFIFRRLTHLPFVIEQLLCYKEFLGSTRPLYFAPLKYHKTRSIRYFCPLFLDNWCRNQTQLSCYYLEVKIGWFATVARNYFLVRKY